MRALTLRKEARMHRKKGRGHVGDGDGLTAVDFIEKKAIAINRKEIHIRRKPTNIIVRTAPIRSSNPAVPNRPTPDFDASIPSVFRYNKAVIIANAKRMTIAMMTPPSSFIRESKAVSAFSAAVQSAALVQSVIPRSLMTERAVAMKAPTARTMPTIAVMKP